MLPTRNEVEIFRGAGAVAAVERAMVLKILQDAGVPCRVEQRGVWIPADEEERAGAAIRLAMRKPRAKAKNTKAKVKAA